MSEAATLPRHPALISGSVMLAALLYSIDWTIAAVALPHMKARFPRRRIKFLGSSHRISLRLRS